MLCDIISKWGLIVHAGCEGKKSKTEMMLFHSTSVLDKWRQPSLEIVDSGTIDAQ